MPCTNCVWYFPTEKICKADPPRPVYDPAKATTSDDKGLTWVWIKPKDPDVDECGKYRRSGV